MIGKIGITSIFVTHDQDEAVEVADEIIVTNQGRVEQMGTPTEIYKNPKTPFVAQFIGESAVITDYDRLKGFHLYQGCDRAIIRPEFVKAVRFGTVKKIPESVCGRYCGAGCVSRKLLRTSDQCQWHFIKNDTVLCGRTVPERGKGRGHCIPALCGG